jgi:hypothetical protein
MIFTLEALRAQHGDSLLLHWGDPADPQFAIIDGGPPGTYRESLAPRIEKLRETSGVAEDVAIEAQLAMVSHIDADHIAGLIDLTKAMIRRNSDSKPAQLRIRKLWHNAFEDLVGAPPAVDAAALSKLADETDHPDVAAAALVAASVGQGATLRDNARTLGIPINSPIDGLIEASGPGQPAQVVPFDGGLKLTIIAPDAQRVADLHDKWEAEREAGHHIPPLVAAAHDDTSVPNLSSIVVLAEFGGHRILLTGDARGDLTLAGLEQAGLVEPDGIMELDILKVQHHGSSHDVSAEDFRRLRAKHYVFSANGKFDNPDLPTLDAILEGRPDPDDNDFTVHFTYEAHVDHLRAAIAAADRHFRVEVAPEPPADKPWIAIDLLDPL